MAEQAFTFQNSELRLTIGLICKVC